MKRLLSAGSGPIFQICKAFRADYADATHNPEFTILEWYRPGSSLQQMIDETAAVAALALSDRTTRTYRYAELFEQYVELIHMRPIVGPLYEWLAID
jgi:lysyl-tRNA synthetase class 2